MNSIWPVIRDWLVSLDWLAVAAIGTISMFITMVGALIFSIKQVKAMKSIRIADLLLRLDDRFCSNSMRDCRKRMEALDLQKELTDEEDQELTDFLGFFELVGLLVDGEHIPLDDANIMFGSAVTRYRERFRNYIDESGYHWNYLKKFADQVQNLRGQQIQRH